MIWFVGASDNLPDDPETLKAMLLAERHESESFVRSSMSRPEVVTRADKLALSRGAPNRLRWLAFRAARGWYVSSVMSWPGSSRIPRP